MSLILAIEPDRDQATRLDQLIRGRVHAELVHAATTEGALAAIGDRVPDLVLIPSLLSPQEDAALAGALRVIATAAHVRMLTIPVLAAAHESARPRGVLGKWRKRSAAKVNGCDPSVFADQIATYLEEAAAERAAEREDADYADADAGADGDNVDVGAPVASGPEDVAATMERDHQTVAVAAVAIDALDPPSTIDNDAVPPFQNEPPEVPQPVAVTADVHAALVEAAVADVPADDVADLMPDAAWLAAIVQEPAFMAAAGEGTPEATANGQEEAVFAETHDAVPPADEIAQHTEEEIVQPTEEAVSLHAQETVGVAEEEAVAEPADALGAVAPEAVVALQEEQADAVLLHEEVILAPEEAVVVQAEAFAAQQDATIAWDDVSPLPDGEEDDVAESFALTTPVTADMPATVAVSMSQPPQPADTNEAAAARAELTSRVDALIARVMQNLRAARVAASAPEPAPATPMDAAPTIDAVEVSPMALNDAPREDAAGATATEVVAAETATTTAASVQAPIESATVVEAQPLASVGEATAAVPVVETAPATPPAASNPTPGGPARRQPGSPRPHAGRGWVALVDALRRDLERQRHQAEEKERRARAVVVPPSERVEAPVAAAAPSAIPPAVPRAAEPAPVVEVAQTGGGVIVEERRVARLAPQPPRKRRSSDGPRFVPLPPRPKRKRQLPAQDEWGLFDPDQCGFAALLAKLDEITDAQEDLTN